jgi:hypothetical protein
MTNIIIIIEKQYYQVEFEHYKNPYKIVYTFLISKSGYIKFYKQYIK